MARDQFNFTPDFELLLTACVLQRPMTFHKYVGLIEPQFFVVGRLAQSMRQIKLYYNTHSSVPGLEVFGQMLEESVQSLEQERFNVTEIRDLVTRVGQLDTRDWQYVEGRVQKFCIERALIVAIKKSVLEMQDGSLNGDKMIAEFNKALNIGQDLDDLGLLLHRDVDKVIDQVVSKESGVFTGIPQLDAIWKMGLAPGWLLTFLAPPKRYKTTVSFNIGLSVASYLVGADVIYYACEITQEHGLLKCMYNQAGLTETDLMEGPERFRAQVKHAISQKVAGHFFVKGFPIGSAKISTLKAHHRNLVQQTGIKPKLIIIDYADSIAPSDEKAPPHIQQAQIYKDAIAFGKEAGAAVIMPDRCTGDTVDKIVPNVRSFQGAFAKAGIVDAAIGLCATDDEYHANVLRWFVFLNRHGAAFQHYRGKVDPERAIVDFGEEIPYNPDDAEPGEYNEEEGTGRKNKNRRGKGGGGGGRSRFQTPEELQED